MPPAEPPPFPFRAIELAGLGGRIHGPLPQPWRWETTIPHFNFWFLIRGAGWLRCRGRDYRLEPGTCFLFTPGSRVAAYSASEERLLNFSIHFFPMPRRALPERTLRPLFGRKVHRLDLFLELARHCAETYKRGDALGLQQAALAGLQMMMHLWREAATGMPRDDDGRILQLLAEAENADQPVPVLARRAGLSASQFTRRVRDLTGLAPREYLIRERIGRACSLLTETSRPVGEVAELLGYADPSYFVRQFQHVMKRTPASFRRAAADGG